MSTTDVTPPIFDDLHRPEEFQRKNERIFPSQGSIRWFMRTNKPTLTQRGAIVEVAGKTLIRGQRFIEVACEIGAQRAARRLKAAA